MTLPRLALRNILDSLFRSSAIALCAALVAAIGLSATLVVLSAQEALRSNMDRMGADLVVIPWGTMSEPTLGAHLMSMATTRWMPRGYGEQLAAVPGVAAVSPQLFLATLPDSPYTSADELFLVAFQPETDFVVTPWLPGRPEVALDPGEAIVGATVAEPDGSQTLTLFGYDLTVAGRLEPTGGDLDHAVFVTFDTAEAMVRHVQDQPLPSLHMAPDSMSAAMVRVKANTDAHQVAVRILEQTSSMIPIESTGLFQTQRVQMIGLLRTVLGLLGITWLLATLVLGLILVLAVHERRRQIAVMRALGAPQTAVFRSLLLESLVLAATGGLVGAAGGSAAMVLLKEQAAGWAGVPIAIPALPVLLAMIVGGLLLAVASVTLGALAPVRWISRQEPALAMRE